MKTGGGIPNMGFGNGGGIGWFMCGGECTGLLLVTQDAGDEPSIEGLSILKSWVFGVILRCRTVCDVTVEHLDVLRLRKFILVLRSFLVSGDFCTGLSSGGFGFINLAGGAIVMSGSGDFLWHVSSFLSFGVPDPSDVGDIDLLLQFLSHSSGVMRFDDDAAFTKCGLRSRWACVSRQKMCILYWFRHLSEQN